MKDLDAEQKSALKQNGFVLIGLGNWDYTDLVLITPIFKKHNQ